MKRIHRMPFGCELLDGGGVRFRLWAPRAATVDLCLDDAPPRPMARAGDGWFELDAAEARAGSRYRYRIDGGLQVPDPASRSNPDDVHGASEVMNPLAFDWRDGDWRGRPWHEAVIYELHVGSFSPEGSFAGLERRLDHLAELGVTAVELMPVADFPGRRNWGYDGVLLFAPDSAYGRPDELKRLVQAAHRRGLMVLLDVVYNHFGPDGNYLHTYAEDFFTDRHHTPWGAAINFDGPGSRTVRDFFIHNALYWLEEYHLDGLRLDAVHAILDDSPQHIVDELAAAVRAGPGHGRHVHLVLENDANAACHLAPQGQCDAQWNDDIHHALHVLLSGERDGYYADYAANPLAHLRRCLAEGFAWQGEPSPFRGGERRGERSTGLPPTAFVSFVQNHDQIGNRALGERIARLAPPEAVRAASALLLLAPCPPLLFMGEEWGSTRPFPFFCDFAGELGRAVTEGRRREFARFQRFADPAAREAIPDPCAQATFESARLDWSAPERPPGAEVLALHRELLRLRRERIAPRLAGIGSHAGRCRLLGGGGLEAAWRLADGSRLTVWCNLGPRPVPAPPHPPAPPLWQTPGALDEGRLGPWSTAWFLEEAHGHP